jgi:hypothetical protein
MRADGWTALAAWLTLGVVACAAVVAYFQVREARKLRLDQTRPFVTADFVGRSVMIMLVVKNIGPTLAQNVQVKFDPALTSTDPRSDLAGNAGVSLEQSGISTLVPGRAVRWYLDVMPKRVEQRLPMRFNVTLTYFGPHDLSTPYVETQVLDLAPLASALLEEPELADVVDRLREIRDRLPKDSTRT